MVELVVAATRCVRTSMTIHVEPNKLNKELILGRIANAIDWFLDQDISCLQDLCNVVRRSVCLTIICVQDFTNNVSGTHTARTIKKGEEPKLLVALEI